MMRDPSISLFGDSVDVQCADREFTFRINSNSVQLWESSNCIFFCRLCGGGEDLRDFAGAGDDFPFSAAKHFWEDLKRVGLLQLQRSVALRSACVINV